MAVDIIIVAFIILMAYSGKRRGLIRTLMSFFSSFIAAAAAYFLLPRATELFKTTPFYDDFLNLITKNIADKIVPDFSGMPEIIADAARSSGEAAAGALAQNIASVIMGIILFLALNIVLRLLLRLLSGVFDLPVLKQVNSFGGLIFGTASAFIILYVIFAVWGCVSAFHLPKALENTFLAKPMFENNLILIFFIH